MISNFTFIIEILYHLVRHFLPNKDIKLAYVGYPFSPFPWVTSDSPKNYIITSTLKIPPLSSSLILPSKISAPFTITLDTSFTFPLGFLNLIL